MSIRTSTLSEAMLFYTFNYFFSKERWMSYHSKVYACCNALTIIISLNFEVITSCNGSFEKVFWSSQIKVIYFTGC